MGMPGKIGKKVSDCPIDPLRLHVRSFLWGPNLWVYEKKEEFVLTQKPAFKLQENEKIKRWYTVRTDMNKVK